MEFDILFWSITVTNSKRYEKTSTAKIQNHKYEIEINCKKYAKYVGAQYPMQGRRDVQKITKECAVWEN